MPVELIVLAILLAICPDLPMPVIITRPFILESFNTAFAKLLLIVLLSCLMPLISVLITFIALLIMAFDFYINYDECENISLSHPLKSNSTLVGKKLIHASTRGCLFSLIRIESNLSFIACRWITSLAAYAI